MKSKFVDCFMLMNTALSINGGPKLPFAETVTEAVRVNVSLEIDNIVLLDAKLMEIQISLTVNQWWFDPRLSSNSATQIKATNGQIWKPKLSMTNGFHQECRNDDRTFWRGFGEHGQVLLSENLVINTFCSSDFYKYPLDEQVCSLEFMSYRFPNDEVLLVWGKHPIIWNGKVSLLKRFGLNEVMQYSSSVDKESGNFSTLITNFKIKRNGFYLLAVNIIPNLITVIISYISICIPLRTYTIKYLLNIFALGFSIDNFSGLLGISESLKVVDLYSLKHILFALLSLLQNIISDLLLCKQMKHCNVSYFSLYSNPPKLVVTIDRVAKVVFPLLYFCVNVIFYNYFISN